MSPHHARHPVAVAVHIDDFTVLGQGIGTGQKNIADRSFEHGPETIVKMTLDISDVMARIKPIDDPVSAGFKLRYHGNLADAGGIPKPNNSTLRDNPSDDLPGIGSIASSPSDDRSF